MTFKQKCTSFRQQPRKYENEQLHPGTWLQMMKNHWKDFHSALHLNMSNYCAEEKLYRRIIIQKSTLLSPVYFTAHLIKNHVKTPGELEAAKGFKRASVKVNLTIKDLFESMSDDGRIYRDIRFPLGQAHPWPLCPSIQNVYLDTCHKSQSFRGGRGGLSYGAGGLSCSNDNLWFGACSTAYKEALDCHWLAAPMVKSTTNKPRALILCKEIFI